MWGRGSGGGPRLDDIEDVEGVAYNHQVASRAMAYARPYGRQLLVALGLTIFGSAMSLLGPYLIKIAIDSHIVVGDLQGLAAVMLITLVVYFAAYLANKRQIMIMSLVGQSLLRSLREDLFHHLQRLPLAYYDRNKTGVIVSRLINDVSVMNDLLTQGLINLFADALTLIMTIAIMLVLSPRLALASFAVMPIMAIAIWIFTQRAKVAYRITRQKIGAVAADFQETIDGARVVQAFAREEVSQSSFDRLNDENRIANIRANTLSTMMMPIVEFTSALAVVAVVWYGGSLILDGEVTLGVLVAFLAYITRFFQPIRELTQFYNQLQAAIAGGERVFELLDEPETIKQQPGALSIPEVRGRVEFRHVWFAYQDEDVLQDISFLAEPGQIIALVGHTGAGKSTMASLLGRFYDPREGAVLLDGHDLRDLSFATLRQNIAMVLQDNFLFAGTVADNIRFGRPESSDSDVVEAAKAARAHDFIEGLSDSYETPVMERAANLSLGQRQLIAVARATLADPRVLILDEATSNVDPRTERRLQKGLETLLAGRTCLVIAHRLSTIRAADQVLVMERGEIVERGRHHELIERRGAYFRLHQQQFAA